MNQSSVEQYVEQSTTILNASTGLDEQSTRTKIIDPFIHLLGWNLYSPEVALEYTVQMMSSDKRVDYALKLEGEPEVFVEAKASDSDITDYNIGQLGDYMQKEWVEFGLITNGKKFIALKLEPSDGGPPEIIHLGSVEIDNFEEKMWLLNLFSKDSIVSGEAENIASNIVKRKHAVEHLRNNSEAISEEVADVVTRDLDETIHQEATELATGFITNLINTIEQSDSVPEKPKQTSTPNVPSQTKLERPSDKVDQTIARRDIPGDAQDSVAVVPAKIERGLDFLFRNQAWGFVHIGQNPEFAAFYITGGNGVSAVWYVAQVADVVDIDEADLEDNPGDIIDLSDPNQRKKKVIVLQPGSLYELEDPIPYAKKYPQSLRYTTLGKFRTAKTTEDLF
ncbi:type I restriction enzyme HsdR N-terminal domain-containing protein [Haladaptatus sp. CMSO5]|uniref:type I restriction enzyme HsdR N-terminal domain-containing protein n=1 Tax=Haladaptatus sp. CMSO5 TaxID=3120514 RepID=UPI002FCDE8CB